MVFSSIPFIYYFLPIVCLLYACVPTYFKNGVLLVSSLFFYAWASPTACLILIFSIGIAYIEGLYIHRYPKKYLLWIFSLVHILPLIFCKLEQIFLLGISFYTFQILSYLVDVYKKKQVETSFFSFMLYMIFFGQLVQGPIVRYEEIQNELKNRTMNVEAGIQRFIRGLVKKVLLADVLAELCFTYEATTDPSCIYTWIYILAYILRLYYDFAGYSDMAIGLGTIFGFHLPENFDHPLQAKSIQEFWHKWHMTLGRWFKDYIYIPLGGNRVSSTRWIFNISVVWTLTALWHGISFPFLLWGCWFIFCLILERFFKIHERLGRFYVWIALAISFVLFGASTMETAILRLQWMFGIHIPFLSYETIHILRTYGIVLILGLAGSRKWEIKCPQWFSYLLYIVLFVLCTAFLVHSSFHSFLYFQF